MQPLRTYIMPVVSLLLIQPAHAKTIHNLQKAISAKTHQHTVAAVVAHQTDSNELAKGPNGLRETSGVKARPQAVAGNEKPQVENPEVFVRKGQICLDFSQRLIDKKSKGPFLIRRSQGRLGDYQTIAKVTRPQFIDQVLAGSPYDYYYEIQTAKGEFVARLSMELQLFGENTFIYSPADNKVRVGMEVNQLHEQMFGKEFSPNRYALLFKSGDYKDAGLLKIPFYVQIAGLGKVPYDVAVSNIHTPPHLADGNGTCTFWRSAENLSVIGPESYAEEETFKWAVSQAAPLRRIYSTRVVRNQWANGWVSGGYTADCYFEAAAGSKNQQQWYTRNSFLNKGRGKFEEIKYNYCFQGVDFGPTVDKSTYQNNWAKGGNVTIIPATPVIREKPFVFFDQDGRYKVFRPALKHNHTGVSYTRDNMGAGDIIDIEKEFYVAKPGVSAAEMNRQLQAGKHLLITPGMYTLSEPLRVSKANTIILGLGLATLIPGSANQHTAIAVDDVAGVTVASLMFDAHYSSHSLIQVGPEKSTLRHDRNPTLLADLFLRIGGFRADKVHVDQSVIINSNDVIGDHFWIWRADHGVKGSVGWDINTTRNGLVVNGDYMTMYALFNEHFQEYQTYWTGNYGRTYFFQCESPYDAPNQAAYRSENGTRDGFAAYKVADAVQQHEAYAFGIYDVLVNPIRIESAVEVPVKPGVRLKHICNNSLSSGPNRGFGYLINQVGKSTYNTWRDNRTYVVEFP
ncbi:coagulation factor 5/8 type domain-containing protein [Sphingobacterium sp.]|uniref:coagulation factor 5/8 type domain-containing protein n=1 Tax=Sphingobacterium sp. TaxID=341027 RepID=UPI0028AFA23D|nr:coagulation factor 5/8 type domain-containing protein [Sphingobacterium sp.]